MNDKSKKIRLAVYILLPIFFCLLMLFLFSGGNLELLKSIFLEEHTRDELRDKLADFGVRGYVTIAILSMLQVIVAVLPAEPVQVLSGVTFGFPIGLACCMVGVFLGNSVIFLLYRAFGESLHQYFVKNLHFDFDKAATSKKIVLIVFIMYFLPAIPYGMICFFAASVGFKYHKYITITLLGALPSVCIGVGLGYMAIASSWVLSLVVFALLLVIIAIMMIKRNAIFSAVNAYVDKHSAPKRISVKKYSPFILHVAYIISRIIFFFKGVKLRYTKKVDRVEAPAIVLCNHGSFIDFAYAGTLIRRNSPNFIVARMYFYKNTNRHLLSMLGCFPKSMFALDIESAKNCTKVLKSGGMLAFMPEARLSTAGKFEDIQEGTWAFLKKCAVPVYTVKINGDYFAKPKWARSGLRRGSLVEAELDILFTKEELSELSLSEIKTAAEERLYYDEFEWIKSRPHVRYKNKRLAEGLEGILSRCPICDQKYAIETKGRAVRCAHCGKVFTLDDRYSFVGELPFKNFSEWYDWQSDKIKNEILSDSEYTLKSGVELFLPSRNGSTTLESAGTGECTLDRSGLTYVGTKFGEEIRDFFPISEIYRLLFGSCESFEVYRGKEIHLFVPENPKSAVDWYIASSVLYGLSKNG